MKPLQLQILKSALKKCQYLETGILTDKNHFAAFAEERSALEAGLELTDTKALARLAQLQVLASLAPQRAEIRHATLEGARQELVEASHEFIREQLRPRCLQLRQLAEARVRKSLEQHYPEESDLAVAVNVSGVIVELENIAAHAIIAGFRTAGCQEKAAQLLQAWADADQFEKAHLN